MDAYRCPNCNWTFREYPTEPMKRERRHALLQAAAALASTSPLAYTFTKLDKEADPAAVQGALNLLSLIDDAENILAEIERRET